MMGNKNDMFLIVNARGEPQLIEKAAYPDITEAGRLYDVDREKVTPTLDDLLAKLEAEAADQLKRIESLRLYYSGQSAAKGAVGDPEEYAEGVMIRTGKILPPSEEAKADRRAHKAAVEGALVTHKRGQRFTDAEARAIALEILIRTNKIREAE